MAKKIYIIFTIIFLSISALIIGYIIKQEKESMGKEYQNKNATLSASDKKESSEGEAEENIVIQNKEDASKILGNTDSLINSVEADDISENN